MALVPQSSSCSPISMASLIKRSFCESAFFELAFFLLLFVRLSFALVEGAEEEHTLSSPGASDVSLPSFAYDRAFLGVHAIKVLLRREHPHPAHLNPPACAPTSMSWWGCTREEREFEGLRIFELPVRRAPHLLRPRAPRDDLRIPEVSERAQGRPRGAARCFEGWDSGHTTANGIWP